MTPTNIASVNFVDTTSGVIYYIDDVQVASHSIAITANMRPVASDLSGGPTLAVDWMRMSPYPASCDFVSRVLDAGLATNWLKLDPTVFQPTGTSISFQTRTSDGVTWSTWAAVGGEGSIASPIGRYFSIKLT